MDKVEYLDALKRALAGLPPLLQAKTLAYYEQRFVDGAAAGRVDTDIARELDDPKKIAMTLRANACLSSIEQKRSSHHVARRLVSALGLAVFNLFMVVPALVHASLLAAMLAGALGFYVAGIAVTASGLAGANELVLGGPLRQFIASHDVASHNAGATTRTRVWIDDDGIHIVEQDSADDANAALVIRRATAIAGHGIRISTGMDAGARTTQALFGLSMVVGAIILFLLSLVVMRYTVAGIRRYIDMNVALFKGN